MRRLPVGFWIFIAAAVVIVGTWLTLNLKRQAELTRVAEALGYSIRTGLQRLPPEIDDGRFYLFTQGRPEVLNPIHGERDGFDLVTFGFSYDAGMGEEGSRELPIADVGQIEVRTQTVVWLHRQGLTLPDFDLSPSRSYIRRAGARFGLMPVGIDGADDFRDRYMLLGREPDAVRRRFTPAVRDWFTANPGWYVEGRGDRWLVYRIGDWVDPDDLPAFLDQAIDIIERIAGPPPLG